MLEGAIVGVLATPDKQGLLRLLLLSIGSRSLVRGVDLECAREGGSMVFIYSLVV